LTDWRETRNRQPVNKVRRGLFPVKRIATSRNNASFNGPFESSVETRRGASRLEETLLSRLRAFKHVVDESACPLCHRDPFACRAHSTLAWQLNVNRARYLILVPIHLRHSHSAAMISKISHPVETAVQFALSSTTRPWPRWLRALGPRQHELGGLQCFKNLPITLQTAGCGQLS